MNSQLNKILFFFFIEQFIFTYFALGRFVTV